MLGDGTDILWLAAVVADDEACPGLSAWFGQHGSEANASRDVVQLGLDTFIGISVVLTRFGTINALLVVDEVEGLAEIVGQWR